MGKKDLKSNNQKHKSSKKNKNKKDLKRKKFRSTEYERDSSIDQGKFTTQV